MPPNPAPGNSAGPVAVAIVMSWKTQHHKIYEARVLADCLARLAKRFDLATLPFSGEELQTLAKRARQSFRGQTVGTGFFRASRVEIVILTLCALTNLVIFIPAF